MSEAPNLPEPCSEALARILVRAVLAGKSPTKLAKLRDRLGSIADDLEANAQANAAVYSIRDGGVAFGQRPADLALRAAAIALRDVLPSEIARAVCSAH